MEKEGGQTYGKNTFVSHQATIEEARKRQEVAATDLQAVKNAKAILEQQLKVDAFALYVHPSSSFTWQHVARIYN